MPADNPIRERDTCPPSLIRLWRWRGKRPRGRSEGGNRDYAPLRRGVSNRHVNWQIKPRMSGIDAEPLVPQHYRVKDRGISSHMERGEEIRGSSDVEQTSAFNLSSLLWSSSFLSPPLSPLSSSVFLLHWICFWTCFLRLLPLVFSLALSLGVAAMVTSSLHEVHLQTMKTVQTKSNSVQQNTSSSVQASIDKHITCLGGRRAVHSSAWARRAIISLGYVLNNWSKYT